MKQRRARITLFTTAVLTTLVLTGCSSEVPNTTGASEPVSTTTTDSFDGIVSAVTPQDEVFDGPNIDAPTVPACPYAQEVAAVPAEDQFDKALELGCEHDIFGTIEFTETVHGNGGPAVTGLISSDHALSVDEMHAQGFITDEDYQRHLDEVDNL